MKTKTFFSKWFLRIFILTILLTLLAVAFSCKSIDKSVSYSPVYKEQKGLKHAFLLDNKGLIWVMNFTRHCLSMQPKLTISFAKEIPYKRFKVIKYEVNEMRGYNCDGDFAVLVPLDSPLIALLRTHYIRAIDIETLGGGRVVVSVTNHSEAILSSIQALNWKSPIPILPDEDNTREPIVN